MKCVIFQNRWKLGNIYFTNNHGLIRQKKCINFGKIRIICFHTEQDLVFSVKLYLGLIPWPLTLDPYPLSLISFPLPLIPNPRSLSPRNLGEELSLAKFHGLEVIRRIQAEKFVFRQLIFDWCSSTMFQVLFLLRKFPHLYSFRKILS